LAPKRLLFVDDEEAIRLTLPPILEKHGFEVTAVANVAEAIAHISQSQYDVLITDLNIEKPGDGFAVIATMNILQPKCINIILTAYPAFDYSTADRPLAAATTESINPRLASDLGI
jgi:DNA-binding NtrC family response regulator